MFKKIITRTITYFINLTSKQKNLCRTLILALILILGIILRAHQLTSPPFYMFDEVYHIPTARLMSRFDARAFEWYHSELSTNSDFIGPNQINETLDGTYIDWLHPPLHKYWQAINMWFFGELNPLSWRLSSLIAGVLVIFLTYLLACQISPQKGKNWGLLAALIVAIDPMLVTQSKIGMNDMAMTMWLLLAIYFWLHWWHSLNWKWLVATAITFGVAVATKWSAALPLAAIGLISIFAHPAPLKSRLAPLGAWAIISLATYFATFTPFFLSGKPFTEFIELNRQILIYQTNVTAGNSPASPAISWPWGFEYVDYAYSTPTYSAVTLSGWPPLMITGFISVVIAFIIALRHRLFSIFVIVIAYLSLWIPWIASPRPMFLYHYVPAMPLMYLCLSFVIGIFFHCFFAHFHPHHFSKKPFLQCYN